MCVGHVLVSLKPTKANFKLIPDFCQDRQRRHVQDLGSQGRDRSGGVRPGHRAKNSPILRNFLRRSVSPAKTGEIFLPMLVKKAILYLHHLGLL